MDVQDADGMAIEDADADADGHQVNLELGENTIAVAVTAGVGDQAVTTHLYGGCHPRCGQ